MAAAQGDAGLVWWGLFLDSKGRWTDRVSAGRQTGVGR